MSRAEYHLRAARAAGSLRGLSLAACVIGAWAIALYCSLFSPAISRGGLLMRLLASAACTWMHTALFITAHEAMHGLICPGRPRLNHAIGWACARAFAHNDYRTLLHAHWAHHRHPGRVGLDPDFHDGLHRSVARWFVTFMLGYLSVEQMVWMGITTVTLHLGAGLPASRIALGWIGPLVLSSIQLFYFGTYLPHREPKLAHGVPYAPAHRARSDYGKADWWHVLTCLNFGLHAEHHALPFVPWWRLQTVRFDRRAAEAPLRVAAGLAARTAATASPRRRAAAACGYAEYG
jgi:beta-carotene ketolase (CrtW type)